MSQAGDIVKRNFGGPGDPAQGPGRSGGSPQPGAASDSTRRVFVKWFAVVVGADLLLAAAHAAAPAIAIDPLVAYCVGFAVVCASALLAAIACPPLRRRALPFVALPALLVGLVAMHPPPDFALALLVTPALLLGGVLVGSVVGHAIEHPGHLLFVAIVSSAADVLSVFHPSGPSNAIAQSRAALSLLALPWPLLGSERIEAFLGVGDVLFAALYVATTRRHGLSLLRTLAALSLGFAATMLVVVKLEAVVPALPVLGLAMVLAQPAARRPPVADRVRGFALAALVVALVAALLLR
jgi:hypothetical protein